MNIELDVLDADLQPVSTGDNVDPNLGLKLKVYGPVYDDGGTEQMATVHFGMENGILTLTVYRDFDIPIKIQTVDYFDGSRDNLSGADPEYYTVLRDR